MADGGLFIGISGNVSRRLLQDMESLENKLDKLSRAASKYAAISKIGGKSQLGKVYQDTSRKFKDAADRISGGFDTVGDAAERSSRRIIASNQDVAKSAQQLSDSMGKAKVPEVEKTPDVKPDTGKAKTEDIDPKKLKNLDRRNELYNEYYQALQDSVDGEKQARTRTNELISAIAKEYRALYEAGRAYGEGRETLNEYVNSIDIATLRHLDLNKQLKVTKNGFENLSDEAADALKLSVKDVDALTGRLPKANQDVANLDDSVKNLGKSFDELDISNQVKVDAFKRQIGDVRKQLTSLAPRLKEVFGPEYVDDLHEQLDEFNIGLKNAIDKSKEFAKAQEKTSFDFLAKDVEAGEYQKQIDRLANSVVGLQEEADKMTDMGTKAFDDFGKGIGNARKELKRLEGFLSPELYRELDEAIYNVSQRYWGVSKAAQDAEKEIKRQADSFEKAQEKVAESHGIEDMAARSQWADFYRRLEKIRKLTDDLGFEEMSVEQLGEAKKELNDLNKSLYRVREIIPDDELKDFEQVIGNANKKVNTLTQSLRGYDKQSSQTTGLLRRMWRAFDRVSHVIIRQIHLWGILAVVTVGAQAAYAALAGYATKLAASLGETATKLNMTVQETQELQTAAVATGTSVKDMKKALEELNTTVIDAIEGKKKAKEAFDDLGIEFDTLVNKGNDTEAMFELVMNRLDDVGSSAKRMALAEDIFGEGPASTLINLVGSLEEARNAMKQFDIMMSEDAVRSAERLWNKIRGLWLVIKRQFISAAVEASHVINNFADELLNAAAKGNVFEGTIVPAVKSTIGILKALYDAGKVVYWILHRLYEAWDALIVPIKMLLGLGVVRFFNWLTAGLQGYIAAMKGATTWTARFGVALRGVLRATGYYLIVEAIMWISSALQEASEVAKKTELTFKEAFAAIAETAIESLFNTMALAMSELPSILKQTATIIGQSIWDGILHGIITAPTNLSIRRIVYEKLMGGFEEESGLASDKSKKILENFRNKTNEVLKGMDFFGGIKQDASESRKEMLKTAEVAEGAGDDIVGTVEKMAKEGRVGDVERLIPFAKTEVQDKIEETKEKIKEYSDYINTLRHPTHIIDDEILQKHEQLKVRLEELQEQYEKMETDIKVTAAMNKFEENLSNSMERAKLKFKEGSMELLQYQEQVINARAKKYQDLLKEYPGMSDDKRRAVVNAMLEAQNEAAEKEAEQLEHRYNVIQKGAERNIQTIENEMEQRNQLLENQVAEGKKYEEDAALERAKAQEKASKEILEVRKNEVQRVKDLLGENLAMVKMVYGANSDEVEWFKETIQAKEEADQKHVEARNERLKQIQQTAEATFQREKELAKERQKLATIGLPEEEGTRYTSSRGETGIAVEIETKDVLDSLQKRRDAQQKYNAEVLAAYDERIKKAEDNKIKQERLIRERKIFARKATEEMKQMEDELARKKIREQGSALDKIKLGLQNQKDDIESQMLDIADMSKNTAQIMTDELGSALDDFVMGTKSAKAAFSELTSAMLSQITQMMTQHLVRQFMQFMMGGQSTSGGGMTGPPQAGTGTQATSMIGTILGAFAHKGGVVGSDVGVKLDSMNSAIASAMLPRKHNGSEMRSDEYAAVLQKGEQVRTKEQTSRDDEKQSKQMVVNNNISVQAPEGKVPEKSIYQIKKNAAKGLQQAMMKE